MPLEFDGVRYTTIADIRSRYQVAEKTIKRWIDIKLVPEPPVEVRGARRFRNYGDPAWIAAFEKVLHTRRNGGEG